jgi:hypothetical protein
VEPSSAVPAASHSETMKTQPNLPPRERDTRLLFRSLIVALIAYLVLAFTIAHLNNN